MREAQEWFSTSVESTRTAWKASTAKALFWMALYGASSAGWLVTARLAVDAEVTAPIFLVELLTNLLLVAALAAVWCARGRSGPLLPSPALLAVELLKATANVLALLAIRFVSPLVASVVSNAYPCVFLAISACMFSFKADAGTFGRAVGLVATLIAYTVALDVGGAGARALEPVGIACIVASMTFGCFADCLSEGRLAERRSFADVLLPWGVARALCTGLVYVGTSAGGLGGWTLAGPTPAFLLLNGAFSLVGTSLWVLLVGQGWAAYLMLLPPATMLWLVLYTRPATALAWLLGIVVATFVGLLSADVRRIHRLAASQVDEGGQADEGGAGSSFGLESSSSLEPLESAPSLGSEAAS
jgi:hypothetical protein